MNCLIQKSKLIKCLRYVKKMPFWGHNYWKSKWPTADFIVVFSLGCNCDIMHQNSSDCDQKYGFELHYILVYPQSKQLCVAKSRLPYIHGLCRISETSGVPITLFIVKVAIELLFKWKFFQKIWCSRVYWISDLNMSDFHARKNFYQLWASSSISERRPAVFKFATFNDN